MFRQFIPPKEQVDTVEYLGSLGLIFKTHSFACVTDQRVASLLIKGRGQTIYTDALIDSITAAVLYNPPKFSIVRAVKALLGGRGPGRSTGLLLKVGQDPSVTIISRPGKHVVHAWAIYRAMAAIRAGLQQVG
jgi:hypothetical protein